MMRSWRVRIAPLACLATLALAGAQDGGDRQDWKASLTQVNREASEQFRAIAKIGSDAGDWEAAQLFLSLAYFLENFDPIIRGTWKAPGEGQDKLWDASKNAVAKVRDMSKPARMDHAASLKGVTSYSAQDEGSSAAGTSIIVEDWNGFDVAIRERAEEFEVTVRQRTGDPASAESLTKRRDALKSLTGILASPKIKDAIDREVRKVEEWIKEPSKFPGDPRSAPVLKPTQGFSPSDRLLFQKYLALAEDARKAGADDVALSAEVLGHLFYYLPDLLQALRVLNDYRLAGGLKPVAVSALMSYGCMLHARYLFHEPPNPSRSPHEEASQSQHYTPLGAKSASSSVIAHGTLAQSVHTWMATLYHRVPLLNPDLEKVGIGRWTLGRVHNTCLDVLNGIASPARGGVVVFPPKDYAGSPTRFSPLGEVPNPLPKGAGAAGYPITVSFFPASKITVKDVKARLLDGAKAEVECWVSWPGNPATEHEPENGNSICLIPKQPLRSGTTYRVEIEGTVGSEKKSWPWSFTTAN